MEGNVCASNREPGKVSASFPGFALVAHIVKGLGFHSPEERTASTHMAPTYNFFQPPANTGVGLKGLTFEGTVTIGSPQTVEAEAAVLVDPVNVGTGVNVVTIGGQNYLLVNVNDVIGAAGTLNALNTTAVIVMGGMSGVGVLISGGGTLIGSIVPEVSMDGGTTWEQTFFFNGSAAAVLGVPSGGLAASITVSSPSASQLTIYTPPGTSNVRVRVSSFTSGSSTATLRATEALTVALNQGTVGATAPPGVAIIGGVFNTTPTTLTNGQAGSLQLDTLQNLLINIKVGVNDNAPASAALAGLNQTVAVPMQGLNSAGLLVSGGGNLVGTLTPELSFDGGTTWQATFFYNPTPTATLGVPANGLARSVTVSSPAASELSVLVAPGTSNVRVRVSAFTSGSSNAALRAVVASNNIQFSMALDGAKWTYSIGITGLVTVTGATDVFTITGANGIVTRVLRAAASLTIQTAAQYVDIQIIKRSTANTAGTSTTPTPTKHDPQAPAASSTINAYTANPTTGTLVGVVDVARVFASLTGTAAASPGAAVFNFGQLPGEQAEVLRANTDVIAINLNAPANAGTGDFSFRFTEE